MKILCLFAYPQCIQDVGDFVSSAEHKQRFLTQTVAVCQSYNGSQWDPRRDDAFTFTFTFSHLADAFIQSDLQLGST